MKRIIYYEKIGALFGGQITFSRRQLSSDKECSDASRDFGPVSFALKLGNEARYGLDETTPAPATSSPRTKRGVVKKKSKRSRERRSDWHCSGQAEFLEAKSARERHTGGGYGRAEE